MRIHAVDTSLSQRYADHSGMLLSDSYMILHRINVKRVT
jgi:hypothetical protein